MGSVNKVLRIKELITQISKANEAYYRDDSPVITDREYDWLFDELTELEKETGIVFANSPTKKVSGSNREEFEKVTHTKRMLSAKKTKSIDDIVAFAADKRVMLSWKLDGLTLVLRYKDGCFEQAITRGEDGMVGEDITHTVSLIRNIPKKVKCKESFEVRGEGVISWADFGLLNREGECGHPRNTAAGAVRSSTPDRGTLSHIDFYAFELIYPGDESRTKEEQMDFMTLNRFDVVGHTFVGPCASEEAIRAAIKDFDAGGYAYPADGIIAEYDDLDYGRSLGATAHHENRMIALKWEDGLYETIFRRVDLAVTRNGKISLTAEFDPVLIDGTYVKRADLHSINNFEQFRFGIGDTIKVYKANMIIPQIAENETQSGTYKLPERCPCCGSLLEHKVSSRGTKSMWCPNEDCIAKNAQKIARFCDSKAMNMEGFTATVLEKLMAYGFVKNYADLYDLEKHREQILMIPGFGFGLYDKLIASVEGSRSCRLAQFLTAVGIPLMGPGNARAIDEYFDGSWDDFEKAVKEEFSFFHIAGVSQALSRNIHVWYSDEKEEELWRPVLKEISFIGSAQTADAQDNPFKNAKVVITGTVNNMNRKDIKDLLALMGAVVCDSVTKNTKYLIVGEAPGMKKIATAMELGIEIIPNGSFARMLSQCEAAG